MQHKHNIITIHVYTIIIFPICSTEKKNLGLKYIRREGGLRPPSSLVWVAGATLISSEEVVSSEFIELSVYYFYIKSKLIVNAILYNNGKGQCLV